MRSMKSGLLTKVFLYSPRFYDVNTLAFEMYEEGGKMLLKWNPTFTKNDKVCLNSVRGALRPYMCKYTKIRARQVRSEKLYN